MMHLVSPIFDNRKLVIASMHAKERVIGPLLKTALGVKIEVPKNFDTVYVDHAVTKTKKVIQKLALLPQKVQPKYP